MASEQQQHGAVVDGQRLGDVGTPVRTLRAAFEGRGKRSGSNNRTERGRLERYVAPYTRRGRRPAGVTSPSQWRSKSLVRLGAIACRRVEAHLVGLVVFIRPKQRTLLGGEQEDQPHHHRQRGFVEFGWLHATQQFAVAVLVGTCRTTESALQARATCSPGVGPSSAIASANGRTARAAAPLHPQRRMPKGGRRLAA